MYQYLTLHLIRRKFTKEDQNVFQMMVFVYEKVENIVEKGENAGYQHFLLFQQCFLKTSFSEMIKVRIVE